MKACSPESGGLWEFLTFPESFFKDAARKAPF